MKHNYHLLVIDPQNDFCDLSVVGAHADMLRLAELIKSGLNGLTEISITLDSHHRLDIAHPTFWSNGDGKAVTPFTQISAAEVRAGKFAPRSPQALPRVSTAGCRSSGKLM